MNFVFTNFRDLSAMNVDGMFKHVNMYCTCAVSVRWSGAAVSDRSRAVIFHDEVAGLLRDGNYVIYRSSTTVASWHYPNGTAVAPLADSNDDYLQHPFHTDLDLIRNKDPVDINPLNNGLWTCRLGDDFVPVGIYQRGGKCNFNYEPCWRDKSQSHLILDGSDFYHANRAHSHSHCRCV